MPRRVCKTRATKLQFLLILHDSFLNSLDHVRFLKAVRTVDTEFLHQLTESFHSHLVQIHVFIEGTRFFESADVLITLRKSLARQFCRCSSHEIFADLALDAIDVVAHFVKWTNFVSLAPFVDSVLYFLCVLPLVLLNRGVHSIVELLANSGIAFRCIGEQGQ